MLNRDTARIYGHPDEYEVRNEVVRFTVKPEKTPRYYESMTIDLDIKNYDLIFHLAWEKTQISFPIKTFTDDVAMKRITEAITKYSDNPDVYGTAAYYYAIHNKDLTQALSFINKALAIDKNRWHYIQKMEILVKMKRHDDARKTLQEFTDYMTTTKPEGWEEHLNYWKRESLKWKG